MLCMLAVICNCRLCWSLLWDNAQRCSQQPVPGSMMCNGPLETTLSLCFVKLLSSTDTLSDLAPVRLVNALGGSRQVTIRIGLGINQCLGTLL